MDTELLTEQELSERWKLSRETIRRWRSHGTGPLPYLRIGSTIRYRLSDVRAAESLQRR